MARVLNGPGDDTPSPGPPTGLLAKLGVKDRVTLDESDTELAIGIKLVSPPDDSRRLAYLKYLRDVYLLPVTATDLPRNRLVSTGERTRTRALLARLAAGTVMPANAFLAPQERQLDVVVAQPRDATAQRDRQRQQDRRRQERDLVGQVEAVGRGVQRHRGQRDELGDRQMPEIDAERHDADPGERRGREHAVR